MIRVFQRPVALVPIQLLSFLSGQTHRATNDFSFGELVLDKLFPLIHWFNLDPDDDFLFA